MDRRQQSVLVHVADVGCDCCVLAAKIATLISSLLNSQAPVNVALSHMCFVQSHLQLLCNKRWCSLLSRAGNVMIFPVLRPPAGGRRSTPGRYNAPSAPSPMSGYPTSLAGSWQQWFWGASFKRDCRALQKSSKKANSWAPSMPVVDHKAGSKKSQANQQRYRTHHICKVVINTYP
jgi:hypothetical protein